jgi:hypothetical protein
MPFPKKVESEDMELCMKTWRLSGYTVYEFERPPLHVEKPNVWVSDVADHPTKVVNISDLSALYTYRGDHYLRLHPYNARGHAVITEDE